LKMGALSRPSPVSEVSTNAGAARSLAMSPFYLRAQGEGGPGARCRVRLHLKCMSNLRISRRAADRLRSGHLWVYRTDIEGGPGAEQTEPGALVTVTDSRNIPLGTALYSSASTIAARIISRTPETSRAQYLVELRARVHAAVQLRRTLAPVTDDANAYRLIFSEADGLPGIVADRYNDLVLLQLLTQGTAQDDVRGVVTDALRDALTVDGQALTLWERPDPRIRELEQLAAPPAGALFSTAVNAADAPTTTTFLLNGLRFHYDAASGQKTGAFLDQRLNYAAAARVVAASGKTAKALDVCTYQGGFALHLAQVCAKVTGVDASHAALEAADRNLLLNPRLAERCETDWIEADAFEYLRHLDAMPETFDAIVLDPPAFAKSKRAAEGALRGYKELNLRAIRMLNAGGTLITNSCSHHVSLEEFTAIVGAAAADAGRRVQLLEIHAAAPDHPEVLTLPETRYLKCLICRVD
jgi:23S rRNA (cytosine1962-C5)-methyltransferase